MGIKYAGSFIVTQYISLLPDRTEPQRRGRGRIGTTRHHHREVKTTHRNDSVVSLPCDGKQLKLEIPSVFKHYLIHI